MCCEKSDGMKKRDIWLIVGIAVVALTALLLLRHAGTSGSQSGKLYIRYSLDGATQAVIPLEDETDMTIDQGEGCVNVLHLSPDGVAMQSSTCKNQQCVQQGKVTLANRDLRPLYNMIVCAPHRLTVELLTQEEANALAQ